MLDVLHYKMDQAGFLAALPYLLMACIVQSAGVLADLARTRGRLSTTQVKLYHSKFSLTRLSIQIAWVDMELTEKFHFIY